MVATETVGDEGSELDRRLEAVGIAPLEIKGSDHRERRRLEKLQIREHLPDQRRGELVDPEFLTEMLFRAPGDLIRFMVGGPSDLSVQRNGQQQCRHQDRQGTGDHISMVTPEGVACRCSAWLPTGRLLSRNV